jgi:hypothetical protein
LRKIDPEKLAKASARLGDAVLDPDMWPEIMVELSAAIGATGGAVLLQGDVRTPDVPRTAAMHDCLDKYFGEGWNARDTRARGVPLWLAGVPVVTEQDFITPEEIRRDAFYNDCLAPFGNQNFAGVGFWADTALWVCSLQLGHRDGPLDEEERALVASLAPRLTETATLATAVGRVALASVTNALDHVGRPALVLDRLGRVLDVNGAASDGFDEAIRIKDRRLVVRDKVAAARLDQLADRIRNTPDTSPLTAQPIVVRQRSKPPVLIRILPIDGPARVAFLGARVLLVLSNLTPGSRPEPGLISLAFHLRRPKPNWPP